MAIFRKVHVQFWSDVFIQTLTPEQKFFFLYLLTNERTKQCGIYEITPRQISYDTGYNVETVLKLIEFFISTKKIQYRRNTNEIAIKNWERYNGSNSPKVKNLITKELDSVKSKDLVDWLNSDTVSIEYKTKCGVDIEQEPEKEREIEKAHIPDSNLVYNAEDTILKSPIRFEEICMNTKKTTQVAHRSLRRYHLWLEEKGKYPQKRTSVFSGFERWLMNEKDDEQTQNLAPVKKMVI